MSSKVLKFTHHVVPLQLQELGRIYCEQGPDYGVTFIVLSSSIVLGRDIKADMMLSDLKISRLHATLSFEEGNFILEAMQEAASIILVNGPRGGQDVRKMRVMSGQRFRLGSSVFCFKSLSTDALEEIDAKPVSTAPLRLIGDEDSSSSEGGSSEVVGVFSDKKRVLLFGLLGLGAFFLLFIDATDITQQKSLETKEVAKKLKSKADPLLNPDFSNKDMKIRGLLRDGMREYYLGNYTRARTHFEIILQISPYHELAQLYLDNTSAAIDKAIDFQLTLGKKNIDAGKVKSAKGNFESVLRILYQNPTDVRFIEAKDALDYLASIKN